MGTIGGRGTSVVRTTEAAEEAATHDLKGVYRDGRDSSTSPPQWGCVERTLGYRTTIDLTSRSIFSHVLSKFVSDVVLTPAPLLVALL